MDGLLVSVSEVVPAELLEYAGGDFQSFHPAVVSKARLLKRAKEAKRLSQLTRTQVRVSFDPSACFVGDDNSEGHLFSVTLNTLLNDEMEALEFGTLDDRREESLSQQICNWLDDTIAKCQQLKRQLRVGKVGAA